MAYPNAAEEDQATAVGKMHQRQADGHSTVL